MTDSFKSPIPREDHLRNIDDMTEYPPEYEFSEGKPSRLNRHKLNNSRS
jgi:hypothetical protein